MTIYEEGDTVTSAYGPRTHPVTGRAGTHHNGIDVKRAAGAKQRCCAAGVVEWVSLGYNYGRGNNVIIRQETARGVVRFRHQHAAKILVEKGQTVRAADTVAAEGASGSATGPHDHFEVVAGGVLNTATGEIKNGVAMNPAPWLGYANTAGRKVRNDSVYNYGTERYDDETDSGKEWDRMILKSFGDKNMQGFARPDADSAVAHDRMPSGYRLVTQRGIKGTDGQGWEWVKVLDERNGNALYTPLLADRNELLDDAPALVPAVQSGVSGAEMIADYAKQISGYAEQIKAGAALVQAQVEQGAENALHAERGGT